MKCRLNALERVLGALRSKSPEEANMMLQRIRTADDIVSLSSPDNDDRSVAAPSEASTGRSQSTDISTSTTGLATSLAEGHPKVSPFLGDCGFDKTGPKDTQRPDTSVYLIRLIIPSAQLTRAAIQSFFSSAGKLFHVFSPEQVDVFYKSVFGLGLDGRPNESQKVAICCLAVVAAIGVQYNVGDFDKDVDQIFYDVARHYFVDVMEDRPLEAMKICAMLAMYNIMDKATVALAYIEVGLGLSKRHNMNGSLFGPSTLDTEQAFDYRRTWRTLIFFSSWLSSTLGYISGSHDSAFQKLVPQAQGEIDHSSDIVEIVQTEMTRISLIKAEILRVHLTRKELSVAAVDAIMQVLQDWHTELPSQMHLSNLGRQDLSDSVRRSIFYAHLLYLGAIILLYRRIASQVADVTVRGVAVVAPTPQQECLLKHAEKGITAAKHSSRILGLLLSERGIFKRCWLVIFQAHTACVVILHSVAQKQLHGLPSPSWMDDLKQARLCLDTLEYCGEIDPVALRFHIRLSSIYADLAKFNPGSHSTMQRTEDWVSMPPDFPPLGTCLDSATTVDPLSSEYLLTTPPNSSPHLADLAALLLYALCRPWGDQGEDAQNKDVANQTPPSSGERLHGRLGWNLGSTAPFSWDVSGLGLKSESCVITNHFLGSEQPSGWSPAVDIEVEEDSGFCSVESTTATAPDDNVCTG